jgi:hypothetical protein
MIETVATTLRLISAFAVVISSAMADSGAAPAKTAPASDENPDNPIAAASVDTDAYTFKHDGRLQIDVGAGFGFPTALTTGLSTGVSAGATVGECPLRWGVRAAWVSTTESNLVWSVTNSDLHLRLTGSAQHDAGRGTFAVRAGIGPTMIHETKVRNQGMRAGLTGTDLQTSAFQLAPALDLEAVVLLHITGPWMVVLAGGPSAALVGSKLHGSWNAEIGVAWQL